MKETQENYKTAKSSNENLFNELSHAHTPSCIDKTVS
jgi:hypothetical protein